MSIAKLKTQRIAAGVVLGAGVALMAMMITTEGEPGLIPIVLVLAGGIGLAVTHARIRSQRRQRG
jgi:hypothetical protein